MTDLVGQTLRGRYSVEQLIGRGGMADVYLALDLRRQVRIALKILREDLAEDPDFVRRFQREAEALARLDHPNIVRFYSFEREGNTAFIVMDYVPGTTLRGRLAEAQAPMPLEEVAAVLRQVGPALAFAHNQGYIHRDIKPGNIMIREDGTALLSDFGIARATEAATMTLGALGTPAYMSPEQILGREVSRQTDIYCLGVVLYEMVTGRRPFVGESGTGSGTTERIRDEHLHQMPPDPRLYNRVLSDEAVRVLQRALAKDPAQRWPDVPSLVTAWLQATGFEETQPARVTPAGPATRHPTPVRATGAPPTVVGPAQPTGGQPAWAPQPTGAVGRQDWLTGPPPPVAGQGKKRGALLWVIVGAVVVLLGLGLVCAIAVLLPALSRTGATPTAVADDLGAGGGGGANPTATREGDEPRPTSTRRPTSAPEAGEPTPTEVAGAGGEIVVAPDGSGDSRGLADAVASAPDGATLVLSPGTYFLREPLLIERPLQLRGAGRDQTEIISEAGEVVLRIGADFSAEGVAFTYSGGNMSNVVEVEDAVASFRDCRFSGGVWDEQEQAGGSGLLISGSARATVIDCESSGNELYGVEVINEADATIESSTFTKNENGGIAFWGSATGAVRGCDASSNGYHGVAMNEQSQTEVRDSTLSDNQYNGIAYFDQAGGTASDNECARNGYHGIGVNEEAQVTLINNRCHQNQDSGISFFNSAGGQVQGNECRDNTLHGIAVSDQAAPTLEGNTCTGNKDSGISYFGSASGIATKNVCSDNALHGIAVSGDGKLLIESNECERNGYHGISVYGQAQPDLRQNRCRENGDSGITYSDTAGGSAYMNDCAANTLHGIAVTDQTTPYLEANTCYQNRDTGIAYFDSASGTAINNECFDNTAYGIYVASSANPELIDNQLHDNGTGDLEDQRS